MKVFTDYESLDRASLVEDLPIILPPRPTGRLGGMVIHEAYAGTAIVSWYGNIERQLISMEEKYRNAKNQPYADKLHTFLQTWKDNEITGSMNIEVLEVLQAAASQNAVDSWKLANYFSNLRDQLRKLIAAQEELPMMDDPGAKPKSGSRRKSPPQPPAEFGPTAGAPPPQGGDEGPGAVVVPQG